MFDHDPNHQNKMIYSSQWSTFFKDLEHSKQGKPVRLEQGADVLIEKSGAGSLILDTLHYQHDGKGDHLTITTAGDAGTQKSTINFNLIWATFDEDGGVVAVEIVDEQNRKVILRFEAS
jgi:uncharacterized protein YuzE